MDVRSFTKPGAGTVPPKVTPPAEPAPAPDPNGAPEDTQIRQYRLYLETQGLTDDDYQRILSTILSGDALEWSFELFGKIPVAFALRKAWASEWVIREIDRASLGEGKNISVARVNFLAGMHNLASSLAKYGERTFRPDTEPGAVEALAFIGALPGVIQNELVRQLSIFDRAVAVATSEWAVKNFTGPRKD